MARLTRKFLTALGIEDEGKQDEIIEAHREAVDALKEERDSYKEDAEKLPGVQKELDDLKEAAEKNGETPYKAQYEELKQEYEAYKADMEAKEVKANKVAAYKAMLKEVGISEKRIDAIVKVSAVDDVELDAEGRLKNADALKEAAKTEWADFIVKEEMRGAQTNTPPAGTGAGGDTGMSRAAQNVAKHNAVIYGTNANGGKKE